MRQIDWAQFLVSFDISALLVGVVPADEIPWLVANRLQLDPTRNQQPVAFLFSAALQVYAVPLDPLQGVSIPKSAPFDDPRF